jgi:hypothetical protein
LKENNVNFKNVFDDVDKNGSGKISKKELISLISK